MRDEGLGDYCAFSSGRYGYDGWVDDELNDGGSLASARLGTGSVGPPISVEFLVRHFCAIMRGKSLAKVSFTFQLQVRSCR